VLEMSLGAANSINEALASTVIVGSSLYCIRAGLDSTASCALAIILGAPLAHLGRFLENFLEKKNEALVRGGFEQLHSGNLEPLGRIQLQAGLYLFATMFIAALLGFYLIITAAGILLSAAPRALLVGLSSFFLLFPAVAMLKIFACLAHKRKLTAVFVGGLGAAFYLLVPKLG
jgi:mannose/fructose/N-acetylgalactosamine-specific phosphotransferase system component IIC